MGIHIEALILFILIFLSGSIIPFGVFTEKTELVKIFLFYIPSLALIWHLILKAKKIDIWIISPGKKDLKACLTALPCLFASGFAVFFAAKFAGAADAASAAFFKVPSSVIGWVMICISCVLSAYLEESYFRYYILTNKDELNLNTVSAFFLSVSLFSVCHISSGPWSFLNAAISGAVLSFLFLKFNSFHGIAIAHGLYNIAAYIINSN